jgi:hypothetical protein
MRTKKIRTATVVLTAIAVAMFTGASIAGASVAPQGKARGATTVTLDQATIGAIVGLGLTPAPVSPGVLGTHGDDLLASFPIVGNLSGGVIKHTGGLSLSAGSTVLALTNYAIDTNEGVLTAAAAVNGDSVGRLPLFDLGSAPEKEGCLATASLSLTNEAADALTAVFGAPDLSGADLGDACVAPRG